MLCARPEKNGIINPGCNWRLCVRVAYHSASLIWCYTAVNLCLSYAFAIKRPSARYQNRPRSPFLENFNIRSMSKTNQQ